jgi:formylglycine-generating enzyme required for sulfatase activity
MSSRFVKGGLIGLGALMLSTLGIFASDVLQGIDSRVGNLASLSGDGVCPQGMALHKGSGAPLCVDVYEVSPGDSCPNQNPKNVLESEKNASTKGCYPASVESHNPWTYITLTQAQRACAESGKRLPTSDEWYALALGTDETACNINGSQPRVAGESTCRSSAGMYDMVGNVWEWVNETVNGTEYQGRELPKEGYVGEADASGIAIVTDSEHGSELYGNDYFWSKPDGVFGMIRGGFYGSGADAGLYTVNASVPTNFATQGVGFRCIMNL